MTKWTVWAVEDDPYSNSAEVFDIGGYDDFQDAYNTAVEEVRENGAAICAYVTKETTGNIWYALDGLTHEGVYPGPGITGWREALAEMNV